MESNRSESTYSGKAKPILRAQQSKDSKSKRQNEMNIYEEGNSQTESASDIAANTMMMSYKTKKSTKKKVHFSESGQDSANSDNSS
jgi:hypothetical protein